MSERYEAEDFHDAFAYCREKGHPVSVVITSVHDGDPDDKPGVWKIYPSGAAHYMRSISACTCSAQNQEVG